MTLQAHLSRSRLYEMKTSGRTASGSTPSQVKSIIDISAGKVNGIISVGGEEQADHEARES